MLVRRVWPGRPSFGRPFVDDMRREMLRLLDSATRDQADDAGTGVFPPMNVTQDNENFYVRAELPGIDPDALSISALRNRVLLAGKREIKPEHERASYHRKERAEGSFSRTITLPTDVNVEGVDAKYGDGILTLKLPKAEEAKARQITVRT